MMGACCKEGWGGIELHRVGGKLTKRFILRGSNLGLEELGVCIGRDVRVLTRCVSACVSTCVP